MIFSHGNSTDLAGIRDKLVEYASHLKINILAYEYPGFGPTNAKISDIGIVQNIIDVY